MPQLTTERLLLVPTTTDDATELHAAFGHREAMRFMPERPHRDADHTRKRLEQDLARPGSHLWTVRLREGSAIGIVDFMGETRLPGMGYLIHPDHWSQGYATEACRAVLAFGFDQFGFDRAELWIDERNLASQRLARKLDFGLRGRLTQKYRHRERAHTMLLFGRWAHEWRGESRPRTPLPHGVTPVLMVHDVAAAVAFYRDRLGVGVDFLNGDPLDHAGVSRGDWSGAMVNLQLTKIPPERPIEPSSYVYLHVGEGLDRLFEEYREKGVEVLAELESYPWGMREFTVRDGEGHVLWFGMPG